MKAPHALGIGLASCFGLAYSFALAQELPLKPTLPTAGFAWLGERIIVKMRAGPKRLAGPHLGALHIQSLAARSGTNLVQVGTLSNGAAVLAVTATSFQANAAQISASLATDPNVEYAEPDARRYPLAVPNDPGYSSPGIPARNAAAAAYFQWHLYEPAGGINIERAWDITQGSSSITVGILDSGWLPHAEILQPSFDTYDFVSADTLSNGASAFATANDENGRDLDARDPGDWVAADELKNEPFVNCRPQDGSPSSVSLWHGLHIAGIIGARANNAKGIAGINWNASLLPVRVLGKCGGYLSDIMDGAKWAAGIPIPNTPINNKPAKLLNLSLGTKGPCTNTEQDAINAITATDVRAIVVAAGNDKLDVSQFVPANCNGVIAVGAVNRNGGFPFTYANFGHGIAISAPGGENFDGILSLSNNGQTNPAGSPAGDAFVALFGTSPAAAIVSGVISLMLADDPSLTRDQIRAILESSARNFPDTTCNREKCGAGIVDAGTALTLTHSKLRLSHGIVRQWDRPIGAETPQTITISNFSAAAVSLGTAGITGSHSANYSKTADSCSGTSLAPSASCSITVAFNPSAVPLHTADLSISTNAQPAILNVKLAGTGLGTSPPPPSGGGGGGGGGGCALAHMSTGLDVTMVSLLLWGAYGVRRGRRILKK